MMRCPSRGADSVSRIAWFTPLPPSSSGVARYNIELLPLLAAAHAIDVFIDGPPESVSALAGCSVRSAHDFVWKHYRDPYDLVVYQIGNAPCHDYMWGYVARYPGLVVLHDGQLHHARALSLHRQKRDEDYVEEFRYSHPDVEPDIAELGVAGLLGPLTFLWALRRPLLDSARLVVVHNTWLAARLHDERPDTPLRVVEMGVAAPVPEPSVHEQIRRRHNLPPDAMVFTAFGTMTPEKRIPEIIRALAAVTEWVPRARLLLVGQPVGHYNPAAEARALGMADRVTITGFVSHEDVPDYLAASDVCLCLRWPTSRETSAAWLRCLGAGRATITTDLAHVTDVPTLDPRTWTVLYAHREASDVFEPPPPVDAVAVSINMLDEEHSLLLAMRRLGTDARLRRTLGQRARDLWQSRFTLERMAEGYRAAIAEALTRPAREAARRSLPAHFMADGTGQVVETLRGLGVPDATLADLWGARTR